MLLFKKYVINQVPIRTDSMSVLPFSHGIDQLYTFKTPFDEVVHGAFKPVNSNVIVVPRESVPYASPKNDFRVSYPIKSIKCVFKPRNNQLELCEQSLSCLITGQSHIFQAHTGFGKTICGAYIASQLGQPTMIIVTKEDLVYQWRNTLIGVLKIPENKVGHVQQDICEWKGKSFVIGLVQSLIIPDRYPREMYDYFGMVIYDEVHCMASDCFIRSCMMFRAKYRLGLSATPERKDGKTKLLHWHIGPTLIKGSVQELKPKILVRQTGWKIPVKKKLVGNAWQYIPIPHTPSRMMLVFKAMAKSDLRNLEIVNFVKQAYKAGRICLVMSDLRESHLNRLFQMFTGEGIPGNEIGYYVGGMKKHELDITKTRKIVLATYAMASTGTDVPHWDSLVLTTPRSDIVQPIGRVLRVVDGKKQPVILDLVDHDSIFQGFHMSRMKHYASIGAEVVKV